MPMSQNPTLTDPETNSPDELDDLFGFNVNSTEETLLKPMEEEGDAPAATDSPTEGVTAQDGASKSEDGGTPSANPQQDDSQDPYKLLVEQFSALKAEIASLKAQPTKEQEVEETDEEWEAKLWENPRQAMKAELEKARAEIRKELSQNFDWKLHAATCEMRQRMVHEDYDEKAAAFHELAKKDQALVSAVAQAKDPAEYIYNYMSQKDAPSKVQQLEQQVAKLTAMLEGKLPTEPAETPTEKNLRLVKNASKSLADTPSKTPTKAPAISEEDILNLAVGDAGY